MPLSRDGIHDGIEVIARDGKVADKLGDSILQLLLRYTVVVPTMCAMVGGIVLPGFATGSTADEWLTAIGAK
ncbi:MAG TPA: hypothetical protein VMT30_04435 [Candidatus Saccharimonadia bacterium]|nr:hypothetical protein [Candidatus Saccharimonadia bacterium]